MLRGRSRVFTCCTNIVQHRRRVDRVLSGAQDGTTSSLVGTRCGACANFQAHIKVRNFKYLYARRLEQNSRYNAVQYGKGCHVKHLSEKINRTRS